jgi:outer membrane protein assembly factor BamB
MTSPSIKERSSPALGSDGAVYVGAGRLVYVLSSDGSLRWMYQTGRTVNSSPAVGVDGMIYVGSNDKKLWRMDLSN